MRQLEVQKEDHELELKRERRKLDAVGEELQIKVAQAQKEKESTIQGIQFNLEEKLEQAH